MTMGELIDYCIEWNEMHGLKQTEEPEVRDATQADIDRFLG